MVLELIAADETPEVGDNNVGSCSLRLWSLRLAPAAVLLHPHPNPPPRPTAVTVAAMVGEDATPFNSSIFNASASPPFSSSSSSSSLVTLYIEFLVVCSLFVLGDSPNVDRILIPARNGFAGSLSRL